MNRRYVFLFAAIVAAALMISLAGRLPRPRAEAPEPVAAAPRTALELVIDGERMLPVLTQVEKGHRVDLEVVNRGNAEARLTLTGYDDRVDLRVGAGARTGVSFLADRPGDGFAWHVDGEPAGRFVVTGSHLVEGHR